MTIYKSIHVAETGSVSFLMAEQYFIVYIPHILYPFLCSWALRFVPHVLAIVKSDSMNTEVHVSFWTMFFLGIVGMGLQGNMVALFLIVLRTRHTVLYSGYTNIHTHQQC